VPVGRGRVLRRARELTTRSSWALWALWVFHENSKQTGLGQGTLGLWTDSACFVCVCVRAWVCCIHCRTRPRAGKSTARVCSKAVWLRVRFATLCCTECAARPRLIARIRWRACSSIRHRGYGCTLGASCRMHPLPLVANLPSLFSSTCAMVLGHVAISAGRWHGGLTTVRDSGGKGDEWKVDPCAP
jgi:hypothetical protein